MAKRGVEELGAEFSHRAKPAREVMSPTVQANFRKARGPGKKPAKEKHSVRLNPEVVAHFKGDDPQGWQTRLNAALEKLVEEEKA